MKKYTYIYTLCAAVMMFSTSAFAQNPPQPPVQTENATAADPAQSEMSPPPQAVMNEQAEQAQSDGESAQQPLRIFNAETYPSLLFTYWEQVAIEDARKSRGQNRAPTDDELERDLRRDGDDERVMPPPEERNIALSGIAYNGYKNWTIWLNGKRVTPDAIPKEAIDLKVFKQYIEIKWFDEYTNQIIPIRLRAHQRFNIDNRMFLPG